MDFNTCMKFWKIATGRVGKTVVKKKKTPSIADLFA
jgi:hypothetical protein